MLQQLSGASRVFRRDDVAFPQRPQRPQRDVFKVADGCGHEVERARRKRRQSFFHCPIQPRTEQRINAKL